LILCDVVDGIPFKTAALFVATKTETKAIGGVNLLMTMGDSIIRNLINELDDLLTITINASKKNIMPFVLQRQEADSVRIYFEPNSHR
jgi:mannose/fructose-specific phosphotransferase system component IIA